MAQPRATLTAAALAELAEKDPSLAEALGLSPKRASRSSISRRGHVRHVESGTPFDQTRCPAAALLPPGVLAAPAEGAAGAEGAGAGEDLRPGRRTVRVDPHEFLQRHSGFGGNNTTLMAGRSGGEEAASAGSPPKAGARSPRSNPPNTALRIFYERGELPVVINHSGAKTSLSWTRPIETLPLKIVVPIFFDGLREEEEPFCFLAEQGVKDILNNAGDRIADILNLLIMPLRGALSTRRRKVLTRVMRVLQRLVTCDLDSQGRGRVGRELVPFYRQILPVFNTFAHDNRNLGDGIDYSQRFHNCPGDLAHDTLHILEATGGPHAALNIIYYVPTYEPLVHPSASPEEAERASQAASLSVAHATRLAALHSSPPTSPTTGTASSPHSPSTQRQHHHAAAITTTTTTVTTTVTTTTKTSPDAPSGGAATGGGSADSGAAADASSAAAAPVPE
jgi:Parkin co-regulated protein